MTRRILLTGASGRVAGMLRPMLRERYGRIVLSDRDAPHDLHENEEFRPADLTDFAALRAACSEVDGIVHLGGQSNEADWETVRRANIEGMYNLLEAARQAGVERFVFASSNHVTGMYERQEKIGVSDPVRPDSRYGAAKAFGEALASLYADKYGMAVLSIRIGHVSMAPRELRQLSIWIHPEDLMQLIGIGLESECVRNEIVFGMSDNIRAFWDNSKATRLGYAPLHRAEDYAEAVLAAEEAGKERDPVAERYQGGDFAAQERVKLKKRR